MPHFDVAEVTPNPLDDQPYDGVAHDTRHACDPSYHDGTRHTVYTGPEHLNWVHLPFLLSQ